MLDTSCSQILPFDNGKVTSPDRVVKAAIAAFDRRRTYIIPGWKNYLLANTIPRLLPRSIVARILASITRPQSS